MNGTRKIVLTLSALAIAGMMLYPPWFGEGYGSVFDPPSKAATIDFARLSLQAVAFAIVAAVLFDGGTDKPAK